MKLLKINLQEYLIALALIIVIPITVYLGCNVIAPVVIDKEYQEKSKDFFKGYTNKSYEKYEERQKEWKETTEYAEHQKKVCERTFIHLIITGIVSCIAFYMGAVLIMPIISAGLLAVGLILQAMYHNSYALCMSYHSIDLFWLELLFVLISFVIIFWISHKHSQ